MMASSKFTAMRVMGGISASEATVLRDALRCYVQVQNLNATVWAAVDPTNTHETLNYQVGVSAQSKKAALLVKKQAYDRVSPAIAFIRAQEAARENS